jgi:putative oxidoreductase
LTFLDRLQPLGLLALRVTLGVIMIAHGYGKVFGISKHVGFVSGLGLPGWLAYPSAGAEFFGGILLIVGLLTRITSVFVLINMLVAVFKVHLPNGLVGRGGYEFPLALSAMAFALIFFGAGALSLDAVIFRGRGGGILRRTSR